MAPNTKAYENTLKYQDGVSKAQALINATKQAQIQILRAAGGTCTSEHMKSQIGGKLAAGMTLVLVGNFPNESIQMVRATPKNRGIKSIRRKERREKR